MDARFFLKKRTAFIRFFYEAGASGFLKVMKQIEAGEAPFDGSLHVEDFEPPYLEDWMEAKTGVDVLGQMCISLLSDTLKLYFRTLQTRVIGYGLSQELHSFQTKEGFVAANKIALCEILQVALDDCPIRFEVIEQVVLARNRSQHPDHLSSFRVQIDGQTLRKHPKAFFANEDELKIWTEAGGNPDAVFTAPSLEISKENLFAAVTETERLADWVDGNLDKVSEWRQRTASKS